MRIFAVGASGTYLTPLVAGKPANSLAQRERRTPSEREVFQRIGQGSGDKEIAAEIRSSANLLDKLGAQHRTDTDCIGYTRRLVDV